MAQFTFDARTVEPDQGRVGAIPKGWYKTIVEKTEIKPTNDGSGAYISVQLSVIEGNYKGSKIFTNFNIKNNSEKALEIGQKQLSALCYAVNVLTFSDTDQLKNIPFFTRVKFVAAEMDPQDPTKVKYEEKNEPSAYRNINDQAAIEAAKTQGAAPAAKPVTTPVAPPPVQQQTWQQPVQQAPVQQPAPVQQAWQQPQAAPAPVQPQAPQPSWQAAQAPQAAPADQPGWAAAPQQPWGQPAAAPQQQMQAAPAAVVPNQPAPWEVPPQQ